MANKYTRQPNKANSQKAAQAVIKSWQCLECGFVWRKSKPIKCSWCGSKNCVKKDVLPKLIRTNKYDRTDKGHQPSNRGEKGQLQSNKWEKVVKRGPQKSNRNCREEVLTR